MIREYLNVFFAGVSALGALLSGIAAFKARYTKKEMEKTIVKLKNHIRNVNDLVFLEPIVNQITKMSQKFSTISSGVLPNVRGGKTEIDYYIDLKKETVGILGNIPREYDSFRDILNDIISAYSSCISAKKTFRELDRDNRYSYEYVEDKYQDALRELNTIIRDIKYMNVDD